MSTKAASQVGASEAGASQVEKTDQENEAKRGGPFSRGFWRREKVPDDGLEFILLEDARVPVAVPRGRKLVPAQRPPRGRW